MKRFAIKIFCMEIFLTPNSKSNCNSTIEKSKLAFLFILYFHGRTKMQLKHKNTSFIKNKDIVHDNLK